LAPAKPHRSSKRLKKTAFSDDEAVTVYRELTVFIFSMVTANSRNECQEFPKAPGAGARHLQGEKRK
jgi:hypothetical protein